jgi:copper resistance protein B
LRADYEALLTNRLILRPRLECDANAAEDEAEGLGTGVTDMMADLQLRYEITRGFAPYLALRYDQKFGSTADFARQSGEQTSISSLNLGIRLLF